MYDSLRLLNTLLSTGIGLLLLVLPHRSSGSRLGVGLTLPVVLLLLGETVLSVSTS